MRLATDGRHHDPFQPSAISREVAPAEVLTLRIVEGQRQAAVAYR